MVLKDWKKESEKYSNVDYVKIGFAKSIKKINKNITPHSLRHSRATELLTEHKVTIEKIKDWLGHDDISTTMIYLHMGNQDDKELMGRIGGV